MNAIVLSTFNEQRQFLVIILLTVRFSSRYERSSRCVSRNSCIFEAVSVERHSGSRRNIERGPHYVSKYAHLELL